MKKVIAIFLPIFYVATLSSQNNINYYEYWFDSDYDNKTEISISPVPQFTLNGNIPTTGLTNGLHTFHIRFKDESAKYSSVLSQFFYKSSGGGPGAANISEYEYWFDNNYAEKILETIAPTPNLQLIENLENDLPIGLHTIHMRFKDSGGLWSSAVSQFFYKSNESGAGTISAYEYWFDENYADKIYEEIPPQEIFQIIDDISADVTNGLHTLHIRFKDTGGLWSTSISHFFYKAGEGVGETNLIKAYRYWFNDLDSLITTIDLPVSVSPYFLVTEVNATALDTGYHVVNFQFQDTRNLWSGVVTDTFYNVGEPELNSISPAIGGNIGDVTVNIYGNGFFENTTVMLINPGVDTVYVPDSLMAIYDSKRIQVTFDLREKTIGFYDVVLEVPEQDTVMKLVNGFEIVSGIEPYTYINVIGFETIRPNQWQSYTITCGNIGNVNATGVPIFIAIPQSVEYELEFDIIYPQLDSLVNWDTLSTHFISDSLLGEAFACKIISLVIPEIRSNDIVNINLKLLTPTIQLFEIRAFTSPPLYQSPMNYDAANCYLDIAGELADFIPGVDCVYSFLDLSFRPLFNLAVYGEDDLTFVSFLGGALNTAFQCSGIDDIIDTYSLTVQTIHHLTNIYTGAEDIYQCLDAFFPLDGPEIYPINTVVAYDPNDKVGPNGTGNNNYFLDNVPYPYLIRFENEAAATALAQTVRIVDSLDATVFDFSTFELGFMSFGDTTVNIPPNQQHFDTYVDLRPELNIVVKLEANFDNITGIAEWKYTALDPNNYLPVVDPLAGFLPPNIIAPEGEGSVFYTIHVKDSLENGVEISNKAYIYFDYNEPIITNEWTNALDNENPVSEVNDLPEFTSNDLFMVSWSGADGGSQIENYDIYYSINGGDYLPWLLNTSELSADFFGFYDSIYAFYSIAKDSAGNLESIPASPDAITTIINCGGFAVDLNFTNDTVICEGTDLDLIASVGDSYIWSNGETTSVITISEPGEYYVTVSLSGICIATSDTINVSISPIPEIPLIIVDGEIVLCEGDSVTLISNAIFGNNWNTGDTTNSIVVYEEGIYTVEITNQCGTSISDPISIIVHSNPLAIISNDGELEFCIGEDVVLTASEGENYLWNNGENTASIVVTESDTLFVTITDLNGCMATSDSVSIIAHPLPAIPIITNSNDTLYTIEGYTYQWFFEGVILPGATNYYLVAVEEGNYKVIITDINECIASSIDFYFNFIAIENSNDLIESLSIFPNPNDGKYTLVFSSGCNSELLISIYDAVGRIILEDAGKIESNLFSKNYDMSGYAKGSYLVKVVCDEGTHYVNVVVQ